MLPLGFFFDCFKFFHDSQINLYLNGGLIHRPGPDPLLKYSLNYLVEIFESGKFDDNAPAGSTRTDEDSRTDILSEVLLEFQELLVVRTAYRTSFNFFG